MGIIFASQVNSKYDSGDFLGAERASKDAGKWTKIGFFIGIAGVILWGLLMILGIGGGILSSFYNG